MRALELLAELLGRKKSALDGGDAFSYLDTLEEAYRVREREQPPNEK